jgi:hypothetical protein
MSSSKPGPKGPRPIPIELREVREKLQHGCMRSAARLEDAIETCTRPDHLAQLIKLQFEFAFGRPTTWTEQSTGLPEAWHKLTPAGKRQVLQERLEILRRLDETLAVQADHSVQ